MLIFIMGEVCASIEAIHLIFQMRRDIIILHHPAKINENRPITLGDNRCTQTYRPIHNDENSNLSKSKVFGRGNRDLQYVRAEHQTLIRFKN